MDAWVRRAITIGAVAGALNVHTGLVGMIPAFRDVEVITGVINLGSLMPLLVALIAGWIASRARSGAIIDGSRRPLITGAIAGFTSSGVLVLLMVLITMFNVQGVLINATVRLVEAVHFGLDFVPGMLVQLALGAAMGTVGGLLHVLPSAIARTLLIGGSIVFGTALMEPFIGAVLRNIELDAIAGFFFASGGLSVVGAIVVAVLSLGITYTWIRRGRAETRRRIEAMPKDRRQTMKIVAFAVIALLLLVLPHVVGQRLADIINTVGIYVLMGLGLNIVVGFAGLLDLGYVAFYAVGAYTTAILTSPASPMFNPEIPFWAALPFVVVIAAMVGLMVGAPVLRLRGDYLAIVTLGFGEIARIVFLSSWAAPVTGGAQGILSIPPALPFTRDPEWMYYPILFFCVLAAIGAASLASSRVGRAWNAMREDESAAEATGVSTVKYKLLAFGLGAAFGCLSGALFAAKIGSIFANSFEILVSINALALIILGGMGNIFGVVVGAFVLVGLPELLREFADFRLLIYGAVLVAMMLLRPEGLLPSRSRRAELHERADDDEDIYEADAGVDTARPVVSA
jgi:branched-chain amino acid transport system permease protein